MRPSEEIVTAWLNQNGFFTMNNYRLGRHEIDILACHPSKGKNLHVEVQVSVRNVGGWWTRDDPNRGKTFEELTLPQYEERIGRKFRKKFIGEKGEIENKIKEIFGKPYDRCFVVGELHPKYDPENSFVKAWKKYDVEVKRFKEIAQEIDISRDSYGDRARQYMQLIDLFRHAGRQKEATSTPR